MSPAARPRCRKLTLLDALILVAAECFRTHPAAGRRASAWGLLLASGRWRRESGWLDGGGIALGAFWMANALLAQFVYIFYLR